VVENCSPPYQVLATTLHSGRRWGFILGKGVMDIEINGKEGTGGIDDLLHLACVVAGPLRVSVRCLRTLALALAGLFIFSS
jgi:hypothetical protein